MSKTKSIRKSQESKNAKLTEGSVQSVYDNNEVRIISDEASHVQLNN